MCGLQIERLSGAHSLGCRGQTLAEVSGGKISGQKMFRVQEDWFLGVAE